MSSAPSFVIAKDHVCRFAARMASQLHAQHAMTVLIGLDADVVVSSDERVAGRVLRVAADVRHAASCEGPSVALLLDPERTGVRLSAESSAAPLSERDERRVLDLVRSHRAWLERPDALGGVAEEVRRALAPGPPLRRDRRVDRARALFEEQGSSVDGVAASLGISAAHLRELFVRDVGIPPRRYRLWRMLFRAFDDVRSGRGTLARSAAEAGFADAAHFSRTCRAMLGYTPSSIVS